MTTEYEINAGVAFAQSLSLRYRTLSLLHNTGDLRVDFRITQRWAMPGPEL